MRSQLGAYVFALLFLFTGAFSVRDDLFGNARPTPPSAPAVAAETAEAATASVLSQETISAFLNNPRKAKPLPPAEIDHETLWLARAIYSETKRPEEQELVAWVIRNRVDTQYRGKRTYKDVVLDPYQFSAFNPESRKRGYYSGLQPTSRAPGWQTAVTLAYSVRNADATYRPFSQKTRHFYSERSMVGVSHPEWAEGMHPVKPRRPVKLETKRFRFFEGVM